jgi:hypothetical protein
MTAFANEAGGPAFPQGAVADHLGNTHPLFGGMTLRDWFAGQALAGLCANPAVISGSQITLEAGWAAQAAREVADAMLAERESPPTPQTNRS